MWSATAWFIAVSASSSSAPYTASGALLYTTLKPFTVRYATPTNARARVRRIILQARLGVPQLTPINGTLRPPEGSAGTWSGKIPEIPPARTHRTNAARPRASVGTNRLPLRSLARWMIGPRPVIFGGSNSATVSPRVAKCRPTISQLPRCGARMITPLPAVSVSAMASAPVTDSINSAVCDHGARQT